MKGPAETAPQPDGDAQEAVDAGDDASSDDLSDDLGEGLDEESGNA